MKRVIVESPYGDPDGRNVRRNEHYLRLCMHDCLTRHGEAPFASHGLYTQPRVLRDQDLKERKQGIRAGFAWHVVSDGMVVYTDLGVSSGMEKGIENFHSVGMFGVEEVEIIERKLPTDLYQLFVHDLLSWGLTVPGRVVGMQLGD